MQHVIIVGAGLVGTLCTRLLIQAGCKVSLVESNTHSSVATATTLNEEAVFANPRAYTISPASVKLLEKVGVWNEIKRSHAPCPYRRVYVWDRNGTASIQFDAEDSGLLQLGFIVQHDILKRRLLDGLDQLPSIALFNNVKPEALRTSESGVWLRLTSGECITADLVIGADGVASSIRELAALTVKQKNYRQSAIVTAARVSNWQAGCAAQVFMHKSVLGILPISASNPDLKLFIWSADTELADQLLAFTDTEFASAAAGALELARARVKLLGPRLSFPLSRKLATTWVKPALALIGDAAHTIHPLAGQGLNLGFADAATLTDKIEQSIARGDNAGCIHWLRQYQNIRRPQALVMANLIDTLRFACQRQDPRTVTLRNQLLALVNQSDSMKSAIMQIASGLWP